MRDRLLDVDAHDLAERVMAASGATEEELVDLLDTVPGADVPGALRALLVCVLTGRG
jgi:hypothetical protein